MTDWYLNPQTGSDANDGLSSAAPVRTMAALQATIAGTASGGDTINIGGTLRPKEKFLGDWGVGSSAASVLKLQGGGTIDFAIPLNPQDRSSEFNCVAAWDLDDSSLTESVGGAVATIVGDAPTFNTTTHRQGNGAAIFAANTLLKFDHATYPQFAVSDSFSFGFWFKPAAGTNTICAKWQTTTNGRGWNFFQSSSTRKFRFQWSTDGGSVGVATAEVGTALTDGLWYFVFFNKFGDNFQTYLYPAADLNGGGVDSSITAIAGGIYDTSAVFGIGGLPNAAADGLTNQCNGEIDGFMYFSDCLEQWEIEELVYRWIDGSDNGWQVAGDRYSIKTLATGAIGNPRSPYRLFEDGVDIQADGQEANAAAVNAPGKYYVDEANETLYYWPTEGAPSDHDILLTDADADTWAVDKNAAGAVDHFVVDNLTFLRSAETSLRFDNATTSTGCKLINCTIKQSNYAGACILRECDDVEVVGNLFEENDHSGMYCNSIGGIYPDDFKIMGNRFLNNRRQGFAIEDGNGDAIGNLVDGVVSDGSVGTGIQISGMQANVNILMNTIRNCGLDGMNVSVPTGGNLDIQYNIIEGKAGCNLIRTASGAVVGGVTVDNNIYDTNGGKYVWEGSTYTTFAEYETAANGDSQETGTTEESGVISDDGSLPAGSGAIGAGVKWWSSATQDRPVSSSGVPYPDFDIDIGGVQSTHSPHYPTKL